MRNVYVFVTNLPPPLEGEQRGPDDVVVIRCEPEQSRQVVYMKSGTDENTLARELSYAATVHAKQEWLYVGRVAAA